MKCLVPSTLGHSGDPAATQPFTEATQPGHLWGPARASVSPWQPQPAVKAPGLDITQGRHLPEFLRTVNDRLF